MLLTCITSVWNNFIMSVLNQPGKLFEITGISASGKTRMLSSLSWHENFVVFDSGSLVQPGFKVSTSRRFLYELKNIFNLICYRNNLLDFNKIIWLLLASSRVRGGWLLRVNIFLNCILKFAYHATLKRRENSDIVFIIDEGVSHIPFLLQDQDNSYQVVEEFFTIFSGVLADIDVAYVGIEGVNTVERLMSRGHKRLKNRNIKSVKKFDKKNKKTMLLIMKKYSQFKSFEKI